MKKIIAILLVLSSAFSLVACLRNDIDPSSSTGDYTVSTAEADVWCALASTQILASEPQSKYDDVRTDKIYLDAAKNDYETGQIIISAKSDLKFTVSVSDLQHTEDADAKISADNCTIYTQMYIGISRNWHGNGAPTGKYPDALLPQKNAVEYEKNVVKAGENGGAWLNFYIPADAKAGNYIGKAIVDLGGEKVTIDISLKVYDVMIPEETTSKTLFTINSSMMTAYELDGSIEMYEKYTQFLVDRRLSPGGMWSKQELAEEGDTEARIYAKTAWYWYEKGMRTFSTSGDATVINGYTCLDYDIVREQLQELAIMSIEKNVDLSDLVAIYDFYIDEPFYITYTAECVQFHIDAFNEMIDKAVATLSAMPEFATEFGQKILTSVKETPLVITDYYGLEFYYHAGMVFEDGTPFSYEGQNVALCPKVDDYNTEEQRAQYDKITNKEKWWYNCNTPSYPYPSYHTDDTPVSAAMFGWMQAQYGITGNLYWAVNYSFKNSAPVEDPYTFNNVDTGANGEGTIIYPGKMYGVDGPVGTVRLEAIADGQEDYELMKWMMQQYEAAGINANAVINRITASVYSGTQVIGGSAEYEEARKLLLTLAEVCSSDAKLMISAIEEKVDEIGRETFTFEIVAANGVELYENEKLLTAENGIYRISCGRENDKNYLNLKAVINGNETSLAIYLGGMQKIYMADSFAEADFTGSFTSAALIDGVYQFKFDGSQTNKITVNHECLNYIGKDTESLVFRLSNSTECQYKVFATYADYGRVEAQSGTISANGEIALNIFSSVNWERNGSLVSIEIQITGTNDIGISQIIVSGN